MSDAEQPDDVADEAVEHGAITTSSGLPDSTGSADSSGSTGSTAERRVRQRALGRVGYDVSEMALGTWGLSGDAYGQVFYLEVDRVIDRAQEVGITLFDTAPAYGNGEMEKKLGERLDAKSTRVVTKLGTFRDGDVASKKFDAKSLDEAFEQSRERLKRDTVDVVLLHCPSATQLREKEGVDFLKQKVKDGDIGAWGVSAGNAEVASAAIECGCDVLEIAYNVFIARDLHGLTDMVEATETAVLARSVLAHGLLCGYWGWGKSFPSYDQRATRWNKEELSFRIRQLDGVRSLVGGDVTNLRAAAIRFVLSNHVVSSAVIGPRAVIHLEQLLRETATGPPYLSDEQLQELPAELEAVGIEL